MKDMVVALLPDPPTKMRKNPGTEGPELLIKPFESPLGKEIIETLGKAP